MFMKEENVGEISNVHFHDSRKGCKTEYKIEEAKYNGVIHGKHCITHNKDFCRCGWEWGWHQGIESKTLSNIAPKHTVSELVV
jgi:hypothetical protein